MPDFSSVCLSLVCLEAAEVLGDPAVLAAVLVVVFSVAVAHQVVVHRVVTTVFPAVAAVLMVVALQMTIR